MSQFEFMPSLFSYFTNQNCIQDYLLAILSHLRGPGLNWTAMMKVSESFKNFLALPVELIAHILNFLDIIDLLTCSQVFLFQFRVYR